MKSKPQLQFRTSDLLILTAAVAVLIVAAPHIGAGPIHGTVLSSVLLVVAGGLLGVISFRLVSGWKSFRYQVAGGLLVAVVSFFAAGIVLPAVFSGFATLYFAVCVYLGGIVGGLLGGVSAGLQQATVDKWHNVSASGRRFASSLGLALLCLAALCAGLIVWRNDEPFKTGALESVMLMAAGSLLGIVGGAIVPWGSTLRHRMVGGFLFSIAAFYCARVALAVAIGFDERLFMIGAVYLSGLLGGMASPILPTGSDDIQISRGTRKKWTWAAVLAPLILVAATLGIRLWLIISESRTVADLERQGASIGYGIDYDRIKLLEPLLDMRKLSQSGEQYGWLTRLLGLTHVSRISLCTQSASRQMEPVEVGSPESLVKLLPGIYSLTIHADHLENSQLTPVLKADFMPQLGALTVVGADATTDTIARIGVLPELQFLQVNETGITDDFGDHVVKHRNLRYLDATETSISDAFIWRFRDLEHLNGLTLRKTRVSDAASDTISRFTQLRQLDLDSTDVSDASLPQLSQLTELVTLRLSNTSVADLSAGVANLTRLEELILAGSTANDLAVEHISTLTQLKKLNLYRTAITDAAIPDLLKLPNLEYLSVERTEVSNESVSRLKQHFHDRSITTSLQLGESFHGQLTAPHVSDSWSFHPAQQGLAYLGPHPDEAILLWSLNGGRMTVFNDERLDSTEPASRVFQLVTGESYHVRVRSHSGPTRYSFVIEPLDETVRDVTPQLGEVIETELTPANSTSLFRFSATAGSTCKLQFVDPVESSNTRIGLVDSGGKVLIAKSPSTDAPPVLLESEQPFYLLIEGTRPGSGRAVRFVIDVNESSDH